MSRVFTPALLRLLLCAALVGALGKRETLANSWQVERSGMATNPGTTSSFSGYIIAVG